MLHKRRNDVLQLQGLGIKGFCSLPCVVRTALSPKLASKSTQGQHNPWLLKGKEVTGGDVSGRGGGGGHLREDDVASSFQATKNNGV